MSLDNVSDASHNVLTDIDTNQNSLIARLTVLNTEYLHEKGLSIPIYMGQDIFVGRDAAQCSLFFDNAFISRLHFRIYSIDLSEDEQAPPPLIYCEDRMSANGTYVNNILIGMQRSSKTPYLLNDGDIISIRPHWQFRFNQLVAAPKKSLTAAQVQELTIFDELYQVSDRVLGSGCYGTVYAASDITTQVQLACKIVTLVESNVALTDPRNAKELTYTHQMRERLFKEVTILAKLNHPNILSVNKVYHSEHSMYIFSELAPGGDLLALIAANNGYLDDVSACVVCHQLTLAVQYLHSEGIAHRDIKPENVLVMRNQLGSRVVLSDFGAATSFRPAGEAAEASRMMSWVGTEDYLAPEVRKRAQYGYTEAADMWSLGIVAVFVLAGVMIGPVQDPSLEQAGVAAKLTMKDQPPVKQAAWAAVSEQGQDFVKQLLVLDASKRITAKEAVDHDWFRKPKGKDVELRRLHEQTSIRWERKATKVNLIERLPDLPSNVKPRTQGKLPDTTASPYFSLEKRFEASATPSSTNEKHRQRTIVSVRNSSSAFVETGPPNCDKPPAHKSTSHKSTSQEKHLLPHTDVVLPFKIQSSKKRSLEKIIIVDEMDSPPRESSRMKLSKPQARTNPLFPQPAPKVMPIQEVSPNDLFGTAPAEIRAAHDAKAAMDVLSQFDSPGLDASAYELIDELQIAHRDFNIRNIKTPHRGKKVSQEETPSKDILGNT